MTAADRDLATEPDRSVRDVIADALTAALGASCRRRPLGVGGSLSGVDHSDADAARVRELNGRRPDDVERLVDEEVAAR